MPACVRAQVARFSDRVLSEEVFLRPLADKFSRLALQLLARYASWLKLGGSSEGVGHPAEQVCIWR